MKKYKVKLKELKDIPDALHRLNNYECFYPFKENKTICIAPDMKIYFGQEHIMSENLCQTGSYDFTIEGPYYHFIKDWCESWEEITEENKQEKTKEKVDMIPVLNVLTEFSQLNFEQKEIFLKLADVIQNY